MPAPAAVASLLALLAIPIGSAGTMAALSAQETPVSLEEARRMAAEAHPEVLAAQARAEGALHQWDASRSYRLPTVGAEFDAVRTDDPVAAFGTRLRQGRFTEADFAPDRLNSPDPLGDWTAGVGLQWAPFDPAAASAARAAEALAQAAGFGSEWTTRAAAFRAEIHYLESVGAEARLAAVEASAESARENLRVMERRMEEGLATEADLLQARAASENARAQVIRAERQIRDARERLALALGWDRGRIPIPVDRDLAALSGAHQGSGAPDMDERLVERPDLRASSARLDASAAQVREARQARLPSLEGFARLGTHAQAPLSSPEANWTVGFRARVPVFTGGALAHRARAVDAERVAVEREHHLRIREAEVELSEAVRALESAREGLDVAGAAARASREAAHLMRRRYEENLVTAADLVTVEARAAQDAALEVDAAVHLAMAAARVRFLSGIPQAHDPASPILPADASLNLGDTR